MTWEPSVRTRHLTVIIFLVTLITGAILCFSIARLLSIQTTDKKEAAKTLTDQLFTFAQRAINNRPLDEPQVSIQIDEAVRSLIKASTGESKEFIYCAIIASDESVIAQSDPRNIRQSVGKILPIDKLENARWYKQLWLLYAED